MKIYIESKTGKLDEEAFALFLNIATEIKILKHKFLLEQGQVCKYLWFLQKGAIKGYEIINGENRNTNFFTEECFFTNYNSLLTKQPSDLYFQATENCQLFQISYDSLEVLYQQNHKIEHIGRLIVELEFIAEHNLRKMLLNTYALGRYEYLEQHQPKIINRFSLKDIASYLGITPVSLSRLRKHRYEKK